jgi:hypothetical protein
MRSYLNGTIFTNDFQVLHSSPFNKYIPIIVIRWKINLYEKVINWYPLEWN